MRESEAVFAAVLTAAHRRDAVVAARVLAAHGTMVELMKLVERQRPGPSDVDPLDIDLQDRLAERGLDDSGNDRINGTTNDRNRGSVAPAPEGGLNARQRWYFEALAAGKEVRAEDLRRHWGVSERTARRDVAGLKELGLIEFVGPSRTGRYRLRR